MDLHLAKQKVSNTHYSCSITLDRYDPYNNGKSRPVEWDERARMEEQEMGEESF